MKDIYKEPFFYYILVPVVAALWPLLILGVYIPNVQKNLRTEKAQYENSQKIITQILTHDPGRLAFANAGKVAAEFDYATAVQAAAEHCGIVSSNYKLSSGIIVASDKQKSQSANVNLKDVGIVRFAEFISSIQLRWPNLQCGQIKLTKKKAAADIWDVDLVFKYYY